MLVDANVLVYATDPSSPHHRPSLAWWESRLNGDARVGLPWQTIGTFLRVTTHPRISADPLAPSEARAFVDEWLAVPVVWIPPVTERTAAILGRLIERYQLAGNAIPDAQLAALAIEHGLAIASADTDFARFDEIRWMNPLRRARA